jgi:hypothetical protein
MPNACNGLFDDRGKTGLVVSPTSSTGPSGARTTTLPWCTDSTNPERTTWATGTGDVGEDGAGCDTVVTLARIVRGA